MKRSPMPQSAKQMKRSGFAAPFFAVGCRNSLSSSSEGAVKARKPGKCAVCRAEFAKRSMTHKACSPECAAELVKRKRLKEEAKARRADRVLDRAKREAMKPYAKLIAEAQVAFNAYIRYRDVVVLGHGCIDCEKPFEPGRPGGSIDAGHYISRGAAPHLRFDERNCFAQRKNCNRPGGATREAVRAGVEQRIGTEALEALESDKIVRKWTHDDLRTIRSLYQLKLKDLRAAHGDKE